MFIYKILFPKKLIRKFLFFHFIFMLAFYICLVINYQQIKNNSMKPLFLVIAAITISATTFAQTAVSNQQTVNNTSSVKAEKGSSEIKSSGSASSATTIKSNEGNSAAQNSATVISKEKAAVAAEKNEMSTKASNTENSIETEASHEHTVSANGQANTTVSAGESNNKTLVNSSLNGDATLSTKEASATSNTIKNEGKHNIDATTEVTVNNVNNATAAVSKTIVTANNKVSTNVITSVKTGPALFQSVKPTANINVSSHIKTATGILIK